MALQNLTAEMGMATFGRKSLTNKINEQLNLYKAGTARISAETAYQKAMAAVQPWERASSEWKVTNEYAPKDVVWLKLGKTPYVGKNAPDLKEPLIFQHPTTLKQKIVFKGDDSGIKKWTGLGYELVNKGSLGLPSEERATETQILEKKLDPNDVWMVDDKGNFRLAKRADNKTVVWQNQNPSSDNYLKTKKVRAGDFKEQNAMRENKDWNPISQGPALKRDKVILTEENTALDAPYEKERAVFEFAKKHGDLAELGPGGGVSIRKGSTIKETWNPATDAIAKDPLYKDRIAQMPPGMYAEVSSQGNMRYKSMPKMGYLTFVDQNNIRDSITVREDEHELIKQLTEDGFIEGKHQGDLLKAGKSAISRWMQGKENTRFGESIIDMIENHIMEDRTSVAAAAKLKGIYQTARGIAGDLYEAGILDSTARNFMDEVSKGGISEEALNAEVAGLRVSDWFNPRIPANQQLEQTLIYTIAMANKPSGRLNLQDLQRAERQVKVTGYNISANDVVTSLKFARKVFKLRSESYDRLINSGRRKADGAPAKKSDFEYVPGVGYRKIQ